LPWRNLRRAFFLLVALIGILALKHSGGGSFRGILESVAPPSPASPGPRVPETTTTVHIQAGSMPR
jgi:hypothetical protein